MGIISTLTSIAKWTNPGLLASQNYWNSEEAEKNAQGIDFMNLSMAVNDAKSDTHEIADTHFDLAFPIRAPYRITSPFANGTFKGRTLIINGKKVTKPHLGVDIGGVLKIHAPEDMIVKKILDIDPKYPCRFIKDPKLGYIDGVSTKKIPEGSAWSPYIIAVGIHTNTKYKFTHCIANAKVKPGDKIAFGTIFAESGNYGYSMGAHCHHETWPFVQKQVKSKYETGLTNWPEPIDPIIFYKGYGVLV